MKPSDTEPVLREELRRLRARVTGLTILACAALAIAVAATILALRRDRFGATEPHGPRTVIADRLLARELFIVADPDTLALELDRPAVLTARTRGRVGGSTALRPGVINLIGEAEQTGAILSPGFFMLLGGTGRLIEMSPESTVMGLRLWRDGRFWRAPDTSVAARRP